MLHQWLIATPHFEAMCGPYDPLTLHHTREERNLQVQMCYFSMHSTSQSQWPCGLRHGSVAAHLLGMWVQMLPGNMGVCLCLMLCVVRYRSLR
jgi:hypothetical protein